MIKAVIVSVAAIGGITCGIVAYSHSAESGPGKHSASAEPFVPLTAEGLGLLPSGRLTDWATYGDHLVLAKLVAAKDLPASEDEIAAGEGYIPRQVSFDVLDVVWSRTDAPEAPRQFDLGVDGWVFDEHSKVPLRLEGQPPLETVGSQYLVVLTRLEVSKFTSVPGWTNLGADTILPVANRRIASFQKDRSSASISEALKDVEGESVDEVASVLRTTAIDPYAAPFMSEPPDERAQSAKRAGRAADNNDDAPATGEY
jgi:hypothetical protein